MFSVLHWRCTPLILALRRQRQADLCEFKVRLVLKVSSRTTKATQRNPVLKNQKKNSFLPSSRLKALFIIMRFPLPED